MNFIRLTRILFLLAITFASASSTWAGNGMFIPTTQYKKTGVFPTAPHANTVNLNDPAKVLYYGGPVLSHPQVYFVLWGDKVSATTKAGMPDFYSSVLNSNYMDWLKVYNTTNISSQSGHSPSNQTINRGSFIQTIQISPSILTGKLDNEQIHAELEKQIAAGVLPAPTADTLYMIHFPPKLTITFTFEGTTATSCQQFCAFHDGFTTKAGVPIVYGVMPDLDSIACSMGCGSGAMNRMTVVSSHELTEAITDPFPTPGTKPAFPQAWNTVDGNEVGDLCQSTQGTLKGKSKTYAVQQEWDNTANACTTGNYLSN